jgi:predicted Zn-dependent peptidase
LGLIERTMDRFQSRPLSKSHLRELKDHLVSTVWLASDDVESRMTSIAKNEMFLGAYFEPAEICQEIEKVSAPQIQKLARDLFEQERMIGILGN